MDDLDRLLESYDYYLLEERIAQNPVVPRDHSRLLVVDSPSSHRHCLFKDLPEFLKPGDLLVLNNTRVLPARLYGRKSSGAMVEVLLLEEKQHNCWLALVKPGKRFKHGSVIEFERQSSSETAGEQPEVLRATVLDTDPETGGRLLQFEVPEGQSLIPLLETFGNVPFPPYVTETEALPEQYQTIYAERLGAVAAPTAGLHFTEALFSRLDQQGIERAFLTLHVGVGTFRPVEAEDITTHQMHAEWIEVPEETIAKIEKTKASGGRVFAVGTTAVRALEGTAIASEQSSNSSSQYPISQLSPYCGKTNIYIYPGYQWRIVDGLITNFHLPKSSLLMLVSALIGRQRLLDLYHDVLAQPENELGRRYRFYSFGDAMLILPESVI